MGSGLTVAGAILAIGLLGCSGAPIQGPAPPGQRPAAAVGTPVVVQRHSPRAEAGRIAAREVPFSFERGGRRFAGVLAVPEHTAGERLPGVVLVHGSGPMSRDGFMPGQLGLGFGFEFPVYAELSSELVRLGYVVARYDKRTCVEIGLCRAADENLHDWSSFSHDDIVVDDFAEDAKAAYHKLGVYDFVDMRRVVFVGHSQGAQLVPRLLTELRHVPAGVMLTPPYRDVAALLHQQGRLLIRVMRQAGKQHRVREGHELLHAAKLLRALKQGRRTPPRILGQPVALWRSWIQASEEAPRLAQSLQRPLLVVGGTYDYNVDPDEMRLWSQRLLGSRHHVAVLPCVTHALNCISQSDPLRIEPHDIGHRIAEGLVSELGAFLHQAIGSSRMASMGKLTVEPG